MAKTDLMIQMIQANLTVQENQMGKTDLMVKMDLMIQMIRMIQMIQVKPWSNQYSIKWLKPQKI